MTRSGKTKIENKLKRTSKGRVTKKDLAKQNGVGKVKGLKNKALVDDDGTITIKKKPSKVELKSVIDCLKKDPKLLVVRKALKYVPYYLKSEGLSKKLVKEIIRLWSEGGEKVRIVCLLCLIRIYTKLKDKERKELVIKKLYSTFLDKCRITKHETMSMIGFMRHSLIELYKLDPQMAFKQAQSSCQQLNITLKNAFTHKNEETYKTVMNWQFANCLILLSSLITSQAEDSPVKTLAQQVIQLNLKAISFLSSPRYYPYYCHLVENLIKLSISKNVFIPVLPHIISILDKIQVTQPRKKSKNGTKQGGDDEKKEEEVEETKSKKEYNMDLLNHVSLDESHCIEYQTAVLNKLHELMLQYLASQCHKISFPELVLLPCVQVKKWVKKNPGHAGQKFKLLLDKIKTDCAKLEEARKTVNFAFTDYNAVDAWEKRMRDSNKLSIPKLAQKLGHESE